tara:strand:- start:8490 stop:8978 length:489 start_codon:yes stop_codon:yes gene_type:complete
MGVLTDKERAELGSANALVSRFSRDVYKLRTTSRTLATPGDVLFFTYKNRIRKPIGDKEEKSMPNYSPRVVLVVSNQRSSGGATFQGKNGALLSSFLLDGSDEVVVQVLKKLYNRKDLASYSKILSGLRALLGRDSYRSFKLSSIEYSEVKKLFLDLPEDIG